MNASKQYRRELMKTLINYINGLPELTKLNLRIFFGFMFISSYLSLFGLVFYVMVLLFSDVDFLKDNCTPFILAVVALNVTQDIFSTLQQRIHTNKKSTR